MIKTLRITSVIAVVLAVAFFVFPAVFGVRSDEEVEQFLSSAGVIEKFNKAKGDKDKRSESQISPLVKEAQAFALYLNPPPKPKEKPQPPRRPAIGPRPPTVSPKFKLIGVSYYASHPELSLALIDEPGRGSRWVRQSSKVSHLIIEQVKDGLVVVRDGKRTFELEPEMREGKSLVIKGSPSGRTGSKPTPMPSIRAGAGVKTDKAPQQLGAKKDAASLKKTINKLKAMKVDVESEKSDTIIDEFISDLEAEVTRVSAEEAKRLGDLGKELKDIQQEPNRADGDVTGSDANLGDASLSEANNPEK